MGGCESFLFKPPFVGLGSELLLSYNKLIFHILIARVYLDFHPFSKFGQK